MTAPKQLAASRIREEIKRLLKSSNYKLYKLCEMININAGHLSGYLKGHEYRQITIDQLHAIGQIFEKPVGWLFELYAEDYFRKERISPKRAKSYLMKCAKLGRQDYIQLVLPQVLECPNNIDIFFSVAERLFYKGKQKESIFFYQLVVDNGRNDRTESVIMSRYRLFQMSETTNVELIWKAVLLFEPLRKELPKPCQLDALLQLGSYCCTLRKWQKLGQFADELLELANLVYKNELHKKKRGKGEAVELLNLERHLVVYYGQGYLLKALALEKQGHYEQAKELITKYADLSWLELLDESGQAEVAKYKKLALFNICKIDILTGNTSILSDFVEFLEDNSEEIMSGFIAIVESANNHGFPIDTTLDKFSKEINSFDKYRDLTNVDRHLQFRYQLAIYQFKNERPNNGIKEILKCMTLSAALNSSKDFIQCIALFEAHRYQVLDYQEREYRKILEGVMRNERLNGRSYPPSEERPKMIH
ncbi:XRE family transcriptional regulator [Brevibacillus laterosporus]|uniref:helix-turn-helix transcriptional regulator n=1 Tax=Brevibacillus laterosporus TaxID=1465 RepID=UPI002404E3F6|nr:helix-turn-helix transcriptional regulator [Brevibacillus laterosporus]MDF9413922.1 XRE family transcriptional regulator [Brevibacillus laterosporus]